MEMVDVYGSKALISVGLVSGDAGLRKWSNNVGSDSTLYCGSDTLWL